MKRMPPKSDLRGTRFGRLTVVEWVRPAGSSHGAWSCLCDCGKKHLAKTKLLRSGDVKSCGCATWEFIGAASRSHGMSRTPLYRVWRAMRTRCEDPTNKSYVNYGGRGIKVCERWQSFENFRDDMGPRPQGATIDRKDNNGNYEPGNCRWATRSEQNRNTCANRVIEHDGVVLCLADWAQRLGLRADMIRRRMDNQGMSFGEAITAPNRYAAHRAKTQGVNA